MRIWTLFGAFFVRFGTHKRRKLKAFAVRSSILHYFSSKYLIVRSDDELQLRKVSPGIDMVYGDLDYVAKADMNRIIRAWKAGRFSPERLRRGWMPPHPTLYVRRHVIETHGAYDTGYRIAADYDAVLRWFGAAGLTSAYIPEVMVKMRVGGESNRSLGRIIAKSREDYRSLRRHGVGGVGTLVWKNLSKLGQFKTG